MIWGVIPCSLEQSPSHHRRANESLPLEEPTLKIPAWEGVRFGKPDANDDIAASAGGGNAHLELPCKGFGGGMRRHFVCFCYLQR